MRAEKHLSLGQHDTFHPQAKATRSAALAKAKWSVVVLLLLLLYAAGMAMVACHVA